MKAEKIDKMIDFLKMNLTATQKFELADESSGWYAELEELKRLAEKGKALEYVIKSGLHFDRGIDDKINVYTEKGAIELLEWHHNKTNG